MEHMAIRHLTPPPLSSVVLRFSRLPLGGRICRNPRRNLVLKTAGVMGYYDKSMTKAEFGL